MYNKRMSEIVIENLSVSYSNKQKISFKAIDDLSCNFVDGKFNVIIGPSGCGKTTLLRCIIGSMAYDGMITVDGLDFSTISTRHRKLGYVSQAYSLYPMMTIFDNIAFPLRNKKVGREEIIKRVNEVAKMLSLEDCLNRIPRQISGGQQQRTALARTIVNNPNIFLLDEPFSNIDPLMRSQERRILKRVSESFNKTVIYVTHDFNEAVTLADYIFVMNEGKIVEKGTPNEILDSENEVVVSLRNATYGEDNALR